MNQPKSMDQGELHAILDALRESPITDISPEMWNQLAEIVQLSIQRKSKITTNEVPLATAAATKKTLGVKCKDYYGYNNDEVLYENCSCQFNVLLQYYLGRSEESSLKKCYQICDCYEELRKSGMKHLKAKIKTAEILNLKVGHKAIGAILVAVKSSPNRFTRCR